jgi:hypothetical protein
MLGLGWTHNSSVLQTRNPVFHFSVTVDPAKYLVKNKYRFINVPAVTFAQPLTVCANNAIFKQLTH